MKHFLIIDDDRDIRLLLNRFLTKKGFQISEAGTCRTAKQIAKDEAIDLIITDFKLPDGDGIQLSKELGEILEGIPVIMITAYSDVKLAVKAVKRGIYDYITKPLHPDELLNTIEGALAESDSSTEVQEPQRSKAPSPEQTGNNESQFIEGNSAGSRKVIEQMDIVAPTNLSVIIMGETGAGKEYVAKEIHARSRRAQGPFIALDCGALPNEIAGSELFGHVKGAFTGALTDKVGSFEYAHGGTIFLDEIGNLEMQHQVKLLRLLQESKVKKLGSNEVKEIDVRVIVATNDDLVAKCEEGTFRQDLYFRLNEFTLDLPPIRERGEDLMLFAELFLEDANRILNKDVRKIGKKAQARMKAYPWPGNLRELKNVMKRSVLLTEGNTLKESSLPAEICMPESFYLKQSEDNSTQDLKSASLHAEYEMILDALKRTGNNKSKAAELLNIDRKTLYNKLKQYETEH